MATQPGELYTVGYDLDKPGQDYHNLIVELKRLRARRALESQWFLRSTMTCAGLRDHLKNFLDSNDRLVVVKVANWASFRAMFDINELG